MTDAPVGDPAAPAPPERSTYRLITGVDDRAFCEKVSAALADGYVLHAGPAVSVSFGKVVCAQAVVLPGHASTRKAVDG